MKELKTGFEKPSVEYRSAPFWSWNDRLVPEELCRQLDEMVKGGFTGGFMHSRIGLITQYLSEEWLNCIKSVVNYAKTKGEKVYLYDEDRWPSGFAGGIVTKHKKYRMKIMKCIKLSSRKKNNWRFVPVTLPANSQWYNNTNYLDTLSLSAVKSFIDSTYVKYKNIVGTEFNKTIPGIFTDEPHCIKSWDLVFSKKNKYLPWTDNLANIFKEKYGYDIIPNLVSLIDKVGNYNKIRYDFWKLITELFVNNFGKQIYDWCQDNNIALTGHYLLEDNLLSQIQAIGAAMPLYEYMQIPGVDHLCRNIKNLLTLKQCSSVAHQLDRKRVLSELYGCSGQNFSLSDRKWIGDWHIALGINLFCPHLWLYTMRGCRKRDYPPTISYQQPHWKYGKIIEDYFARINYVMSQGKFIADFLVVHPIESVWCIYEPQYMEKNKKKNEIEFLNNKLVNICENILSAHYDFDLGDESILSKYSSVESTGIEPEICVGNMKYPAVILPPMITIRESTLTLLEKFHKNGGKIVAVKPLPNLINGSQSLDNSNRLKEFFSKIKIVSSLTPDILSELVMREISIIDRITGKEIPEIYVHRRQYKNSKIYFINNTNKQKDFNTIVKMKQISNNSVVEIWDGLTGRVSLLPVQRNNNYIELELKFYPVGSYLLVQTNESDCSNTVSVISDKSIKTIPLENNKWQFERLSENSITLDYCQYKIGNGKWSKDIPVISLQNILEQKNKRQKISLRYHFNTDFKQKPDNIVLVMEQPEIFDIKINNIDIKYNPENGYWLDTSFRKVCNISNYVKQSGENTVELTGVFIPPRKPNTLIYVKEGVEIESIYLIGDFAVVGEFKEVKQTRASSLFGTGQLTKEQAYQEKGFKGYKFVLVNEISSKVDPEDIVRSGYPFFAGAIKFKQEFNLKKSSEEKIVLKFNKFDTIVARIILNNIEVGIVCLPPYEIDITDFVKDGNNRIEIELINSLRNLLGPHHFKEIEPEGVGPNTFEYNKKWWINQYHFVNFGISTEIITRP